MGPAVPGGEPDDHVSGRVEETVVLLLTGSYGKRVDAGIGTVRFCGDVRVIGWAWPGTFL